MRDQEFITESEYREALSQELVYASGENQKTEPTYSWFTETVIHEVLDDLQEEKGMTEQLAKTILFTGGLRIYTTMDPKIQSTMEEMFKG